MIIIIKNNNNNDNNNDKNNDDNDNDNYNDNDYNNDNTVELVYNGPVRIKRLVFKVPQGKIRNTRDSSIYKRKNKRGLC